MYTQISKLVTNNLQQSNRAGVKVPLTRVGCHCCRRHVLSIVRKVHALSTLHSQPTRHHRQCHHEYCITQIDFAFIIHNLSQFRQVAFHIQY